MSLDSAIKQLEDEVLSYNQGTKKQPKECSADWFLFRAKTIGLAALKQMKADGLQTVEEFQRRYTTLSKQVKLGPDDAPG